LQERQNKNQEICISGSLSAGSWVCSSTVRAVACGAVSFSPWYILQESSLYTFSSRSSYGNYIDKP
jgi:hypothetical protein